MTTINVIDISREVFTYLLSNKYIIIVSCIIIDVLCTLFIIINKELYMYSDSKTCDDDDNYDKKKWIDLFVDKVFYTIYKNNNLITNLLQNKNKKQSIIDILREVEELSFNLYDYKLHNDIDDIDEVKFNTIYIELTNYFYNIIRIIRTTRFYYIKKNVKILEIKKNIKILLKLCKNTN